MAAQVRFTGTGYTDPVAVNSGNYSAILKCGGSTVTLQAKHPNQDDTEYRNIAIPLQDGTQATTTATDDIIQLVGSMIYRLNVTSYVAAGYLKMTKYSD